MAHEHLMQDLPKGVERVEPRGPFFIKNEGGSYTVVVLTSVLITCGGSEGREEAEKLAQVLNEAWGKHLNTKAYRDWTSSEESASS